MIGRQAEGRLLYVIHADSSTSLAEAAAVCRNLGVLAEQRSFFSRGMLVAKGNRLVCASVCVRARKTGGIGSLSATRLSNCTRNSVGSLTFLSILKREQLTQC